MIQNVLSDIGGIGIYGVISICIFVAVFVVAMIWMFRLNKTYLRAMEKLPLEEDATSARGSAANLNSIDS